MAWDKIKKLKGVVGVMEANMAKKMIKIMESAFEMSLC